MNVPRGSRVRSAHFGPPSLGRVGGGGVGRKSARRRLWVGGGAAAPAGTVIGAGALSTTRPFGNARSTSIFPSGTGGGRPRARPASAVRGSRRGARHGRKSGEASKQHPRRPPSSRDATGRTIALPSRRPLSRLSVVVGAPGRRAASLNCTRLRHSVARKLGKPSLLRRPIPAFGAGVLPLIGACAARQFGGARGLPRRVAILCQRQSAAGATAFYAGARIRCGQIHRVHRRASYKARLRRRQQSREIHPNASRQSYEIDEHDVRAPFDALTYLGSGPSLASRSWGSPDEFAASAPPGRGQRERVPIVGHAATLRLDAALTPRTMSGLLIPRTVPSRPARRRVRLLKAPRLSFLVSVFAFTTGCGAAGLSDAAIRVVQGGSRGRGRLRRVARPPRPERLRVLDRMG